MPVLVLPANNNEKQECRTDQVLESKIEKDVLSITSAKKPDISLMRQISDSYASEHNNINRDVWKNRFIVAAPIAILTIACVWLVWTRQSKR